MIFAISLFAGLTAGQAPAKITYDQHILPFLMEKCANCHSSDKKRGGLIVTNFAKIMEGGSSGAVIKAGDPDKSSLYTTMAHKAEPFMPPMAPKVADDKIELVRAWISAGAPENSGSKTLAAAPKANIGLASIVRGRPAGPPPMPAKPLAQEPFVKARRANAVLAISSSPWAPLVAVGGQKQVLLYNGDTQDFLGALPYPEGLPTVIKFSRNGSLMLVAGGRGSSLGRAVIFNVATGERVTTVGADTDTILAADISPDQSLVAISGPGKMLRIYTTSDGKLLHEIKKHTDWITSLEFSPDGVLLATADRSSGLVVWEAFTGREYFNLRGHTAAITEVSWRQDSNILLSSSEDGTIRQWEMENGTQVRSWAGHGGGTLGARYGMDGRIVSAGRDKLVKLWDGNGALQRTFEAMPDLALRATLTHDGTRVVAGDWTGQVAVFAAADGKRQGELSANPLGLSERIDLLTKTVAARQAAADVTAKAEKATRDALAASTAELVAAQKQQQEFPAVIKQVQDLVAKANADATQLNGQLLAQQAQVASRDLVLRELGQSLLRFQDAAKKTPADAGLAQAVQLTNVYIAHIGKERQAHAASVAETTAKVPAAQKAMTDAQARGAQMTQAMAALPKRVEGLQANIKALTARLPAEAAANQLAQALLKQAIDSLTKAKSFQVSASAAKP
jgi:hypothetical protein